MSHEISDEQASKNIKCLAFTLTIIFGGMAAAPYINDERTEDTQKSAHKQSVTTPNLVVELNPPGIK